MAMKITQCREVDLSVHAQSQSVLSCTANALLKVSTVDQNAAAAAAAT